MWLKDWSYDNIQESGLWFFFNEIESLKLSVLSIKYPGAAYKTVLEYPHGTIFLVRVLLQDAFNTILGRLRGLLLHGKQWGFDKQHDQAAINAKQNKVSLKF